MDKKDPLLHNKKPAGLSVGWFNIETSEIVYAARPAQIKALIESSDLGVNRSSDKGWRLDKEWVDKVKAGRRDPELIKDLRKMAGGSVTDTQLLVAIFERELALAREIKYDQEESPFEQEYLESLKSNKVPEGGATYTPKSSK